MLKRIEDITVLQPVRLPIFRRLFIGEGVAVFADQMLFVALTLLALRVAGSGFEFGSVLAVAAIPGAVLMPMGGWMSDRFSPARILLFAGTGRALLALALASIVFLGASSLWPLYGLAGALGVLNALYYPASISTVPAVLDDELLGAGNALVLGLQQASEMAGPVLAASTIAVFGLTAVFGLNALMFAAAAVLFGFVAKGLRTAAETSRGGDGLREELSRATPPKLEGQPVPSEGPVRAIAEGVRYAWTDPLLRTMLIALAVLSFSTSGPLRVGGAMLAEARFGGAEAFAVLLATFGAGSLIGLVVAGSLGRRGRRGFDFIVGTLALGLGVAALGLAPNLFLGVALVMGMGVGAGYLGVVLMSWLQERSEAGLRARVMSLMMFAAVAVDPISYTFVGALSEFDLRIVFALPGSLLVITALLGAATRTVRSFE